MSTKDINNTVFIVLLIIIAIIVFLFAKIRYKNRETKEIVTKPKLFKYIIGVITVVTTFLGIYASDLGHLVIGEFFKYSHKHSLVLEYPDDYIYKNTIELDITAIQNRINVMGAVTCGYKKNGYQMTFLYKNVEELPDYIAYTTERIEDDNIKASFNEHKVSTNMIIIHNGFGSKKYNEFVSESEKNEQEVTDDIKNKETDNTENKSSIDEGQKNNVNKKNEFKKETGATQKTEEKHVQKAEAPNITENPILNNTEVKQPESTQSSLAPPEIDRYNLVEPPSFD